jgi:asparagine synthase (glutamine-hydrolysing)
MGVAPLYYRETEDGLVLGSSIRPLLAAGASRGSYDQDAIRGFLSVGLKDFDAATCYDAVRSFPPASVVRFPDGSSRLGDAAIAPFWAYPRRRWSRRDLSLTEAATQLRETLLAAVSVRQRSDLPAAYELSGGLDSSAVVACAALANSERLATYTVGVPERDEVPFAREMARRYGLHHRVLRGQEESFPGEAAAFATVMEEPYHSPNVFTCYQMRREMKADGFGVVLSGSGGDEVLAGYEYEFWPAAGRSLRQRGAWAHALRHAAGMHFGSAARLRVTLAETIGRFKAAAGVGLRESRDWTSNGNPPPPAVDHWRRFAELPFTERVLFHFEIGQLPYYLRNNDHLTMAIPLEHRFPFLDYRMVELGLQLPIEYLFRGGWTKYAFRLAMEPLLPKAIAWRREKFGFPFPLRRFLRANSDSLQPYVNAVAATGLLPRRTNYSELLRTSPLALWRACSTGIWLQTA